MFQKKRDAAVALLDNLFRGIKKKAIIVFDGPRSLQKMDTGIKRLQKASKFIEKMQAFVKKSQKYTKIHKALNRIFEKLKQQAFQMDRTDIDFLKHSLQSKGYQVVQADFEADIYIARNADPKSAVISADGDFYFHRNIHFFIKARFDYKTTLILFEKTDILRVLGISKEQLLFLGITSGNDYSDNVKGIGINTILKALQKKQIQGNTMKDLIGSFQRKFKTTATFDHAVEAMFKLSETALKFKQLIFYKALEMNNLLKFRRHTEAFQKIRQDKSKRVRRCERRSSDELLELDIFSQNNVRRRYNRFSPVGYKETSDVFKRYRHN